MMVFGSNSEKKYVAPSGGQYVSLQRGGCEDRQHGAGLPVRVACGATSLTITGLEMVLPWLCSRSPAKRSCMFAQVKLSLRTVSVAVRVPGRESSRRHGHIADSVAAVGLIR